MNPDPDPDADADAGRAPEAQQPDDPAGSGHGSPVGPDDLSRGIEEIRRAIDALRDEDDGRPAQARTERLPQDARERIRDALGEISYVQHVYATRGGNHVCHVGRREEDEIRDEIVIVGPRGVADAERIRANVDRLRQGATVEELDELTA